MNYPSYVSNTTYISNPTYVTGGGLDSGYVNSGYTGLYSGYGGEPGYFSDPVYDTRAPVVYDDSPGYVSSVTTHYPGQVGSAGEVGYSEPTTGVAAAPAEASAGEPQTVIVINNGEESAVAEPTASPMASLPTEAESLGDTFESMEGGPLSSTPPTTQPAENVSAGLAGSPAAEPDAEALFNRMVEGVELFHQGQYDQAGRIFREVADSDPKNVDALLAYATARFATGDYALAALAIRQGVNIYPDVVNAPFDLRDNYGTLEDFERQLGELEAWVAQNPEYVNARLVLGFVYHYAGQREQAREVFASVKHQSRTSADLADRFINAEPIEAAEPSAQVPASTQPAVAPPATKPQTSREPAEGQPSTASARAKPVPALYVFVSREDDVAPKEIVIVDGIHVKVEDVDDDPAEAELRITVGDHRRTYEELRVGARLGVSGQSGRLHHLFVTGIDPDTETVHLMVTQ